MTKRRQLRSNAKCVQGPLKISTHNSPTQTDTLMDSENSEISDGAKKYLDDLLREHTAELKGEIDALKTLLSQKNERIEALNEKVIEVVQRSVELSEELRFTREQLEIKIDDNEQYSRKDSLCIEGIGALDGETQ